MVIKLSGFTTGVLLRCSADYNSQSVSKHGECFTVHDDADSKCKSTGNTSEKVLGHRKRQNTENVSKIMLKPIEVDRRCFSEIVLMPIESAKVNLQKMPQKSCWCQQKAQKYSERFRNRIDTDRKRENTDFVSEIMIKR